MPQLTLDDIDPYEFPTLLQEPIVRLLVKDRVIHARVITLLLEHNLMIPEEDWQEILKTAVAKFLNVTDIEELIQLAIDLKAHNLSLLPNIGNLQFIIIQDLIDLKIECRNWLELKRSEWLP